MIIPCRKCHYIGIGTHRIYPVSLLWGTFMIGTGLITFNAEAGSHILTKVVSVLFVITGLYYLSGYFFKSNNCATCKKDTQSSTLPSIHKNSICTECYSINSQSLFIKHNLYGSITFMIIGLIGLASLLLANLNEVLDLIGYLIFLCVGTYGLATNFIPNYCNQCHAKNALIPLDTPRAQALIKEHNLTVPTSTIPETNPNPK